MLGKNFKSYGPSLIIQRILSKFIAFCISQISAPTHTARSFSWQFTLASEPQLYPRSNVRHMTTYTWYVRIGNGFQRRHKSTHPSSATQKTLAGSDDAETALVLYTCLTTNRICSTLTPCQVSVAKTRPLVLPDKSVHFVRHGIKSKHRYCGGVDWTVCVPGNVPKLGADWWLVGGLSIYNEIYGFLTWRQAYMHGSSLIKL